MTASLHDTRVSVAVSLRTVVDAELIRRVTVAPEAEFYAARDLVKLSNEYCLIADLVRAQRLLAGVNRESASEYVEAASDFAHGVLRDCGVER